MGILDSIKELISGHVGDAVSNATGGLQDMAGEHLGNAGESLGSFGDVLSDTGASLGDEGDAGAE